MDVQKPKMLSTKDVAEMFNVAPATVAGWRRGRSGGGPDYVRVGGQARYALHDVQKYIDTMRRHPSQA